MSWKQAVRRRGEARRRDERIKEMKAECWTRVPLRGIAPFTIDRVDGTYLVEFDRTGRSLPLCEYHLAAVRAYDLRLPDGSSQRFATLREAKARVAALKDWDYFPQ
jgi:hypothetical protein